MDGISCRCAWPRSFAMRSSFFSLCLSLCLAFPVGNAWRFPSTITMEPNPLWEGTRVAAFSSTVLFLMRGGTLYQKRRIGGSCGRGSKEIGMLQLRDGGTLREGLQKEGKGKGKGGEGSKGYAKGTPFFPLIVVVGKSPIGVVFGILWNGGVRDPKPPSLRRGWLKLGFSSSSAEPSRPETPSRTPTWEPKKKRASREEERAAEARRDLADIQKREEEGHTREDGHQTTRS